MRAHMEMERSQHGDPAARVGDFAIRNDSGRTYRTFVSGVTGHVGRELARELSAVGIEVHGLTRQATEGIQRSPGHVVLHQIDGRTETVVKLFDELRPDVVIHLAALARRDHLVTDIVSFFEANILYGTQLLEAMRICGCRRFVTAESILQFSEDGQHRPLNLYAATKQAFADLLNYYVEVFGLGAIALVLPTIYSEYETVPKLMTDIASAWRTGGALTLLTEEVRLDLVHVEDVARAFARASALLEREATDKPGSLRRYGVSSGSIVTPLELLALFERIGERKLSVVKAASSRSSRRCRPWLGPGVPGWAPQINLEAGIRRMLMEHQ
jgi:nucleoside-diphosphate-sugar epimerase